MQKNQIPFYGADGRKLGFRTLDTAERLVASGFVKASYGRKKVLRAIWLNEEDGGNPVETQAPTGTRYSFIEILELVAAMRSGVWISAMRPVGA
jgi:hypothetical protein